MIRWTMKKMVKRALGLVDTAPPMDPVHAKGAPAKPATATEQRTRSPEAEDLGELSPEAVERVLDERVRPALRSHGGSVELVGIEGTDIQVRLTGACYGCPSATATLRMGVEAVLRDEFSAMGDLVHVA